MQFPLRRSGVPAAAAMGSLPLAAIPAKRGISSGLHRQAGGGRSGSAMTRSLMQAAQNSRLEASMAKNPETAAALITKNLRTLVARSRVQATEGDYGKKFIKLVRTNVVGSRGVGVRSTPRDVSGGIDWKAKDAIEAAWRIQSRLGNWDTTGTMSRAMFERLWIGTCATDGEAIAIIVRGEDAGPTGFSLQMIDSMRLDPMHNETLNDGSYIRHGIEVTKRGRPIAYHFLKDDPTSNDAISGYYGNTYERILAENVIHAFLPELVGQRRGLPWMAATMWRMAMLKGFEDAAAINARIGASKMGFFKNNKEAEHSDEVDPNELAMGADPGTFENIGDREFVDWNPTFPEASTEVFIRAQLRGISSGLGVAYSSLTSDLSQANYSSMREGGGAEQDEWKTIQEWMIDTLCRRVFEAWIERAVLAGSIKIAGNPLRFSNLEKYKACEFKPRRWRSFDPLKEMTAAKMAVEAGMASRTHYIEEWGEDDAYDVFEEIGNEQKDMKALGVEVITAPGSGQGGNSAATKKPDE